MNSIKAINLQHLKPQIIKKCNKNNTLMHSSQNRAQSQQIPSIKCTAVACHPHEMLFYCSTVKRDNQNQSMIFRLNYAEDNPRKSTISSVGVKGRVNWIRTIGVQGDAMKMFANVGDNRNEVKVVDQSIFEKGGAVELDQMESFYSNESPIHEIQKGKDQNLFITLDKQILLVDPNKPTQPQQLLTLSEQPRNITHSAIDPARGYLTYTLNNQIFITDKQTKTQKYSFKVSPHQTDLITNIHYNPNKQYYLMTGHHDFMKFWDIRKTNIPVKCVSDHHTLLLKSIYNHAHDELILGCYDDGSVGLFRMPSVSSSPSGQGSDALVKVYDEHEDSVYWAGWSHSPWVFVSVSYNATNMVVNVVPSVEKYRILL